MEPFVSEPRISSASSGRGARWVVALGILSAMGYLYLFRLSYEALRPNANEAIYITHFLLVYAILFVLYLLLIAPIVRAPGMDRRVLWYALGFCLLFRAILLPSEPILNDDLYRCLWDGRMQTQGVNPYRYAPVAPDLEHLRTENWERIGDPLLPTVYPPTPQYVFLLSTLIYPDSAVGMKLILLCFDIGAIFLLLWALPLLGRPPEWCLIYAWSPLVLKEIANSGQVVAVSACLLALLIGLIAGNRRIAESVTLATLTLAQFWGALLVPLFHRVWPWRMFGLYLGVIALSCLPFLAPGVNVIEGYLADSLGQRFNAGLFDATDWLLRESLGLDPDEADLAARLAMAALILSIAAWQSIALSWREKPEDLVRAIWIVIGAILIGSPVMEPWYAVWALPLLCVFPHRAWILFSGLVVLAYWRYYDSTFPSWTTGAQYGPLFALLIWDSVRPSRRRLRIDSNGTSGD